MLNEKHIREIILSEIAQAMASNPTEFDVINSFNKINQQFFNNKLPKCRFNLKLRKNYLGYFKYDGRTNNKLINPIISVNGMYQLDSNQLDSIVGHEMIHYKLALSGLDMNCTHGQFFKQMAAQMNTALGLNIDEKIDTGTINYGISQSNQNQPSRQLLAYMNSYARSLNGYASQIKNTLNNTDSEAKKFLGNLYTFSSALIKALNRCVSKQSLNEDYNLLQTPQFVNDFIRGYRDWARPTQEFFNSIIRNRNGQQHYYGHNGSLVINRGATLSQLLYNVFPDIEKEYNKINNSTFNSLNSIPCVINIIELVRDLKDRIENETQNAQGSNP